MEMPEADRNLLVGLFALHWGLIERDQFLAAASNWLADTTRDFGEILLGEGNLSPEDLAKIRLAVSQYLEARRRPSVGEPTVNLSPAVEETGNYTPDRDATEVFDSKTPHEARETVRSGAGSPQPLRYTVLRFHARGGLGKVSLALDEELHREVAFKELLDRLADDQICRDRFICEAEITGLLEHPGVVPVYGLGRYSDGRPFYAMRFIRGDTFKEAIDRFHARSAAGAEPGERILEFRALLRRFIDVCNTVSYAHSRGVVHRDIKPRNVMLGKHGETLVVDWGLAKVVGRCGDYADSSERTIHLLSGSSAAVTQYGSAIGTPAYMSPEQAAGEHNRVGPASDIYSLGALLYHLLVGEKPFTDEAKEVVLEKVCRGDFPHPRQVNPQVPRPLESVCLKAMALLPQARYSNVPALVDDLEHWLADEPVSARPDTYIEAARRWMRRHRALTQAGAVTLVLVAAVSLVAAWLVNRARQEAVVLAEKNAVLAEKERTARHEAQARFRDAQEATDLWLTGAADALKYYPGVQEARRRMLEKAAENYERFTRVSSANPELEIERGRAYLRLGNVRRILESPNEAVQAYRKAQDVFASLSRERPRLWESTVELANSRVMLGLAFADLAEHRKADAEYSRAIAELRDLARSRPGDRRVCETLAAGLMNRSILLSATGAHEEAESLLHQSIREWEALIAGTPAGDRLHCRLSAAQAALGQLLLERGRPTQALVELGQAIQTLDGLVEAAPDDPAYREWRATTLISLTGVQRRCGLYREEEEAYGQAVRDYEDLIKALPDVPDYEECLAVTRNDLALLRHHLGRNPEAETDARAALDIFACLTASYPEIPRYRGELAACYDTLAQILGDLARNEEASTAGKTGIEAYRTLAGLYPDVPQYRERLGVCQSHLGRILAKLGEHDGSEAAFREAVEILDGLGLGAPDLPAYRDELAFALVYQGTFLLERGKTAEAESPLRRAGELWKAIVQETSAPEYLDNLAWFLANSPEPRLRNPQEAIALAKQAVQSAEENAGYWNTLGAAWYRAGDWKASLQALEEAAQRREIHGRDGLFLAMVFKQLGNLDKASEFYRLASQWIEKNQPGNWELVRLRAEAESLLKTSDLPAAQKQ
ncbi:MAG: tetratricopeptide repeat protein [Pirellulales bacterium]|nr:tetratricopeptide repeat protein [Pirellulales bacterium]